MDEAELEAALRGGGVDVHDIESVTPVEFSYVTAHPAVDVEHGEMGRALTALLDLAEAGEWEPTRVEATVLRFEDEPIDTWSAEAEWFEGLLDYRLTETEFSTRVLGTLDGGD